jgi:hypothetical protein
MDQHTCPTVEHATDNLPEHLPRLRIIPTIGTEMKTPDPNEWHEWKTLRATQDTHHKTNACLL